MILFHVTTGRYHFLYKIYLYQEVWFNCHVAAFLQTVQTYSSTDNFLPHIPVSDWLIFCFGNSILHQKKTKMMKTDFLNEKTTKNASKVYVNIK